ncbi:MAG: AsmA family protein [Anaerolineae bacterium]|nr:AsmA family protein [Gloeobacterales cyanobacterium ES-bin-313]
MSEAAPAPKKTALTRKPFIPVWFQRTLLGIGALSVTGVIALAMVPLFVDSESFREPLQKALSEATHRDVVLSRLDVQTFGGVGLKADQLRIVEPDGTLELQAQGVFVELDLFALLTRNLSVRTIELDGAQINLKRNKTGHWNLEDLAQANLNTKEVSVDLSQAGVRLLDSTMSFVDESVEPNQTYQVSNLSLSARRQDRTTIPLNLQGTITNSLGKRLTILTVDGNLLLSEDGDWQKLGGDLRIVAEKFRPRFLRAYTQAIPSLKGLTGVYDLDFTWKGRLNTESRLAGSMVTRLLNWDWPELLGKSPWVAKDVKFDGAVVLKGGEVTAAPIHVIAEGLDASIKGNIVPPAQAGAQPTVNLTLTTGFTDPFALRKNIPIALFPPNIRPWVTDTTGSGKLRTEIALRGSLDQANVEGLFEFQDFNIANPRLRSPIDGLSGKVILSEKQWELQSLRIGKPGLEVTATGTVTRTDDPQLNLKVTSDSVELSAFSNVVGAKVGNLGGRSRIDLNVTGTANTPQILGQVELQDATLQRDGWPQALHDLRGTLIFEAQKLTIANLNMGVGASNASVNGVIEGYGTDRQNPQLAINSTGLDLKMARYVLSSDLIGGGIQRNFRRNFRSMDGSANVDVKLQGDQLSGKVDLTGADLGLSNFNADLNSTEGLVILNDQGVSFDQLRTRAGGSALVLKGGVSRSGVLRVSGNGTLSFPEATSLLYKGLRSGLQARGSVPVSFSLGGSGDLQATADLSDLNEFTLGNALRLAPAKRLTLSGSVNGSTLSISSGRLDTDALSLNLSGSVGSRWRLKLRAAEQISMGLLGRFVPGIESLGATAGTSNLDLAVLGPAASPSLSGDLILSNIDIPSLGISELNGPVSFEGASARTSGLAFKLEGGSNGRISGSTNNFNASFDLLNLDALIADGSSFLRTLQASGSLKIDNGILSHQSFNNLSAQARLSNGNWSLNDLSLAMGATKLSGSLSTNVRSGISRGNVTLRGDINQLAAQWLTSFANQLSGEGEVQLNFSGSGATTEAFVASLEGSGSLNIQNGKLWTADLLGSSLGGSFSSIQGAVRSANTGRFDRLSGPFSLSKGTASFQGVNYSTSAAQMTVNGSLGLYDRAANFTVQGEFARNGNIARRVPGGNRPFGFEIEGPVNAAGSIRNFRFIDLIPAQPVNPEPQPPQ